MTMDGFPVSTQSSLNCSSIKVVIVRFLFQIFILSALSPLYSYVNNTLQGLSTIRISNVENILQEEFYEHLDFNTAVTYLKSMTSRAFSAWVDGICLVYIGICSVTFVLYRGQGKFIF